MKVTIHKCRNISHPFPIVAWAIIFLQGRNPFNKNEASHMSISIEGENGIREFFDSTGDGVLKHSEEKFLNKYKIVGNRELEKEFNYIEIMAWYQTVCDRGYDRLQMLGFLLRSFGFTKTNILGYGLNKLICTELVIDLLEHFHGFKYCDSDNFDLINTWKVLERY